MTAPGAAGDIIGLPRSRRGRVGAGDYAPDLVFLIKKMIKDLETPVLQPTTPAQKPLRV